MIIFKKIICKNFFSVGNKPIEIELNKSNVSIVIGKNGSGKSSLIIDTVFYALYGKSFRKITLGNMVNSINKKGLYTELYFDIGANSYIIKRGIKPNIFEIYINGKLKTQSATIKEYQEFLINHILKMDEKTFKQIVVVGSSAYVPFMHLSSHDRRTVIEDLLNIDIFSSMLITSKNDLKEIYSKNNELINEKNILENNINNSKINSDELKKNLLSNINSVKNNKTECESNIKTLSEKKVSILNNFNKEFYNSFIDELNKIKNKIIPEIDKMKSKNLVHLEQSKKAEMFFNNNNTCPSCKQEITAENKNIQLENILSKIDSINKNIEVFDEKTDFYINKANEVKTKLNEFDIILKEVDNIENLISAELRTKNMIEKQLSNFKVQWDNLLNNSINNLTDLENELDCLNNVIKHEQKKLNSYNLIISLLKDDGIKKFIIKNYLPVLVSLIQKYISIIGMNATFTFDESFNETIKIRNRDIYQYDNLSEGEKNRIDTALLFAFREFAKIRSTISTNLLIFDENDAVLDNDGFNAKKEIILASKDTNIFLISHSYEFYLDVADTLYTIEKQNNFTNMRISKV